MKQIRLDIPAPYSVTTFVREKLRDLPERQRAREEKRRARNGKRPGRSDAELDRESQIWLEEVKR